jgi:hypothetical protein
MENVLSVGEVCHSVHDSHSQARAISPLTQARGLSNPAFFVLSGQPPGQAASTRLTGQTPKTRFADLKAIIRADTVGDSVQPVAQSVRFGDGTGPARED